MGRIITLTANAGTSEYLLKSKVQYDAGQILSISGDLPESYLVEITNARSWRVKQASGPYSGPVDVEMEDDLFRSGNNIIIYITAEAQRTTEYRAEIPIKRRLPPMELEE